MLAGYLLTDIEASVERLDRTPEAMRRAIGLHHSLIDACVVRHGGRVCDHTGDSVLAVFENGAAFACAIDIQRAIEETDWREVGGLAVRVGVHAGRLDPANDPDRVEASRVSRIAACAAGGQILVSAEAAAAFALPPDADLSDLGAARVKGIMAPLRLMGLGHPALPKRSFPSLWLRPEEESPLPRPTSPLFGREREVADIASLMSQGPVRHVTLIGPGGAGKTRLAIAAAEALGQDRALLWIPLEPTAPDIVAAFARALAFPFEAQRAYGDQLIAFLRDKRALVVIDNAEWAADPSGLLDRLLDLCPQVKVLAAGRAPMLGRHEQVYPVGGLVCPAAGSEAIFAAPAYRFFAHETERFGGVLDQSDEAASAFAAICMRVSGSPLALGLTARWTRVLSLPEIEQRLRESVKFLADAPHSREPGADIFEKIFEASWILLPQPLRQALARLSVLSGGFDARDADIVAHCSPAGLAELEVRGLVTREGEAELRFSLHPLVHEYAQKRLADSGEEAGTRARHSAHFLRAAEGKSNLLAADFQRHALNVRAAWRHALTHTDPAEAYRAIERLFYSLVVGAKYREAYDMFDSAAADAELGAYCRALQANCLAHMGEYEKARSIAAPLAEMAGLAPAIRAHALQALGNLDHTQAALDDARARYEAALHLRRQIGDALGQFHTLSSLAALDLLEAAYLSARKNLRAAHGIALRTGLAAGLMHVHVLSGELALREGRHEDASHNLTEALRYEEAVIHPQARCRILVKLAQVLDKLGQMDAARDRFEEAIEGASAAGNMRDEMIARLDYLASLLARSSFSEAKTEALRACRQGLRLGEPHLLASAMRDLARAERGLGNEAQARRVEAALTPAVAQRENERSARAPEAVRAAALEAVIDAESLSLRL